MSTRQRCEECGKKRKGCRPVRLNVDKTIAYVCRPCWRRLDYDEFNEQGMTGQPLKTGDVPGVRGPRARQPRPGR